MKDKNKSIENEIIELTEKVIFFKDILENAPLLIQLTDAKESKVLWKSKNVTIKEVSYPNFEHNNSFVNKDGTISSINKVLRSGRETRFQYCLSKVYKYDNNHEPETILTIAFDITDKLFIDKALGVILSANCELKNKVKVSTITKREKEIIKYFASGKTQKEISEITKLSENTVNNHRKNIYKKLGISKITELVKFAYETNLN